MEALRQGCHISPECNMKHCVWDVTCVLIISMEALCLGCHKLYALKAVRKHCVWDVINVVVISMETLCLVCHICPDNQYGSIVPWMS